MVQISIDDLSSYIRNRLKEDEETIIYINDSIKNEGLLKIESRFKDKELDTTIYEHKQIDLLSESQYSEIYKRINSIKPEKTKTFGEISYMYEVFSMKTVIDNKVWIIYNCFSEAGQRWLEKNYYKNKRHK